MEGDPRIVNAVYRGGAKAQRRRKELLDGGMKGVRGRNSPPRQGCRESVPSVYRRIDCLLFTGAFPAACSAVNYAHARSSFPSDSMLQFLCAFLAPLRLRGEKT